MIDILLNPENWASLLTLIVLEIVLGVDNLIFLSILANRLPKHQQRLGRRLGLGGALITRLILLFSVAWIVTLKEPFVTLWGFGVSWRDVILMVGGLFLIAKSTLEIHSEVEGAGGLEKEMSVTGAGLWMIVIQIAIIDIVFSLDTVMTAVGMSDHFEIMAIAVVTSMVVMLFAAEGVAKFVDEHPTIKMLALSFLILIGVALVADALHFHIPKGYLYTAVAFSLGVESLNLVVKKRREKSKSGH